MSMPVRARAASHMDVDMDVDMDLHMDVDVDMDIDVIGTCLAELEPRALWRRLGLGRHTKALG